MTEPDKLEKLIATCLDKFYKSRLEKIRKLRLRAVISRKNPYLFRALHTEKASEIVEQILFAFVSSSDETIFGTEFFEPIAREVSGGKASDGKGVDIIFETDTEIRAYAVKSGKNAQNSSARDKQELEFNELRQRLAKLRKRFDPILAAAYGRVNRKQRAKPRSFREVAGQKFWQELTGEPDFYLKLIRLMKDIPLRHKETYKPIWDAAVNRLTSEFITDFCTPNGYVDWDKLTAFVSAEVVPKGPKTNKKA